MIVSYRTLTRDDEAALHTLWQAVFVYEPDTRDLLREKVWDDPDFDPRLALVAMSEAGDVVGIGIAVARKTATTHRGYIKLLGVVPSARRQGIGRTLVRRLETALEERGVDEIRMAESAPNYLTPGLDVRYTPGLLLAQAEGYARIGETYNLVADLQQSLDTAPREADLVQQGLTIRRAAPDDASRLSAFLAEHWPAWQAEVDVAFQQQPIAIHLVLRGTEVLGFSGYDTNNLGTGWFGPMGTAPEARGSGIGGVLLKRCLADLKAQGLTEAVIPWVGPIRFYSNSVGARIDRVFYRCAKRTTEPAQAD